MKENPVFERYFHHDIKGLSNCITYTTNQNKKIALIGYDLIDKNVSYLNEGLIHFLIHQNQKRQVYLGVSTLAEHFFYTAKKFQKQF